MKPRAGELCLLLALLLMVGATSWWLLLRPATESDPSALDELATTLDGWQAIEIEMDQDVAKMLNADHNVQRAYHHALGYTVFVYIGYYGASRGGVPEHTPDVCYPSQGWEIVESREQRVGGRDGLAVAEYLVENGNTRRLVHFWYRTSQASGMTSILGLRLRQFLGRLSNQGTDGALIQLSTTVRESEIETARQQLFSLDLRVEAELDKVWPNESNEKGRALAGRGRTPPVVRHASSVSTLRCESSLWFATASLPRLNWPQKPRTSLGPELFRNLLVANQTSASF